MWRNGFRLQYVLELHSPELEYKNVQYVLELHSPELEYKNVQYVLELHSPELEYKNDAEYLSPPHLQMWATET